MIQKEDMVNWIQKRVGERTDTDPNELQWKDWSEWLGRSPLSGVLVALSVTSLGITASLYPNEIKAHLDFGGPPAIFWGVLIFAVVIYMWRDAAKSKYLDRDKEKRKDLIKQQQEAARDLREEVRSLPPDYFLDHYKKALREIEEISSFAAYILSVAEDYSTKREALIEAIQSCLIGLADLASIYDGDEKDRYASNVLIFISSELIKDVGRIDSVNSRLYHVGRDVSVESLKGILDFRKDLSAVSSDRSRSGGIEHSLEKDVKVDENHPPVAFGIPKSHRSDSLEYQPNEARWRIGPGAPHALLSGMPSLFNDTTVIKKWMEEKTTLDAEARRRTMDYIEKEGEPQIGSFLSMPLEKPKSYDETSCPLLAPDLPIGVVNIHRKTPNILQGREKSLEYFDATCFSINKRIGDLVEKLAKLEYEKHQSWKHLT